MSTQATSSTEHSPSPAAGRAPGETGSSNSAGESQALSQRTLSYTLPKIRTIADFQCNSEKIGEGTYGKVFKAVDKGNGETVAVKQMPITQEHHGLSVTSVREIKLLNSLCHENIVCLKEVVLDSPEKWGKPGEHLYLVFEFMVHDLSGLNGQMGSRFVEGQVRCYIRQVLEGLYFCHKKRVLHRDIKGSNMLVNDRGILKLADFGLARQMKEDGRHTQPVVTLWYRAPELLLGAKTYGAAIDMWSVGCLLVELYTRQALFPGNTEIEQIDRIYKVCGTPCSENWPEGTRLPQFIKPRKTYRRNLRAHLSGIPDARALDLIDKLLSLDPAKRPTAEEALDHSYFFAKPDLKPSDLPRYPGSLNELFHKSKTMKRPSEARHEPPAKKFRDNTSGSQYRSRPEEHRGRGDYRRYEGRPGGRPDYGAHRNGRFGSSERQRSGGPAHHSRGGRHDYHDGSARAVVERGPPREPPREERRSPPARPLHEREATHAAPPRDYREQGLSTGFSEKN